MLLAATSVTVLSCGAKRFCTCQGSQGCSSSFSAMQQVYLPGVPRVAAIRNARAIAQAVEQNEPQRPADGGVCALARAEHIVGRVDAERSCDRAVDQDHDR